MNASNKIGYFLVGILFTIASLLLWGYLNNAYISILRTEDMIEFTPDKTGQRFLYTPYADSACTPYHSMNEAAFEDKIKNTVIHDTLYIGSMGKVLQSFGGCNRLIMCSHSVYAAKGKVLPPLEIRNEDAVTLYPKGEAKQSIDSRKQYSDSLIKSSVSKFQSHLDRMSKRDSFQNLYTLNKALYYAKHNELYRTRANKYLDSTKAWQAIVEQGFIDAGVDVEKLKLPQE